MLPAGSSATSTGLPVRLPPTATAVVPGSFGAQVPSGNRVYLRIPSPVVELLTKVASVIHRKLFVPLGDKAGPLKLTFKFFQLSGRNTGTLEVSEIVGSQRMTWPLVVKSLM